MPDRERTAAAGQIEDENLASLLARTMREGSELVQAELKLFRAETEENLRRQISGLIVLMIAVALAVIALAFLAAAGAAYLAPHVGGPGNANLIIGAVALVLALVAYFSGRSTVTLSNLLPQRFLRSVRETRLNPVSDRHG